jgi:hypothetical protein
MRYTCAVALILFSGSAFANTLSVQDLKPYSNLQERMSLVRREMATFLQEGSTLQGAPGTSANPPVLRRDCIWGLILNMEAVAARFDDATTLISLATKMKDHDDELLVLRVLDIVAANLSVIAKNYQVMLGPAVRACSQDDATVTEKQKISEIYDDASALLTSLVVKLRSPNQP